MDTMIKEYISIFYICDSMAREDLSIFSKSNGVLLQTCDDFALAKDQIASKRPDLILIETDMDKIEDLKAIFAFSEESKTVIFSIVHAFPDSEKRIKLMDIGIDDILVQPLLMSEIKGKYKVYQTLDDLIQKDIAQEKKVKKGLEDLDKLNDEVKRVKEELYEERTTLNSALKQINQMTLERERLKKEKKIVRENLNENTQGFFDIFCQLIEIRVEKNRGHGARVAHIANFIGEQLKFDEKKLDDLGKAAMLHEIGLLFIPEKILQKKEEQRSTYEKDLFIQYPVKGADLLSHCSEFENATQIIRSLNEKSDGTGSPEGLKRRYIPLSARILAGADVFDSLKEQKGVNSLEIFLERLEEFSGSRLDPNIVSWLEKYAVLHMGSDAYQVKGVGVHQLEPGMTLGTAIFTNTGTKLFSVNTLLTPDAIDKIKKYNREYPVDETVYIRA